jgi:hypothetical protein
LEQLDLLLDLLDLWLEQLDLLLDLCQLLLERRGTLRLEL